MQGCLFCRLSILPCPRFRSGPNLSQLAPDATRKLAEFTASLKFSDLPPAVVAHAKVLALDSIGCCLYGATLPWTRKVMGMIRDEGGAARATVIGGSFKSSASQAVLVNSTAGHAFESDDMHKRAYQRRVLRRIALGALCCSLHRERLRRIDLPARYLPHCFAVTTWRKRRPLTIIAVRENATFLSHPPPLLSNPAACMRPQCARRAKPCRRRLQVQPAQSYCAFMPISLISAPSSAYSSACILPNCSGEP